MRRWWAGLLKGMNAGGVVHAAQSLPASASLSACSLPLSLILVAAVLLQNQRVGNMTFRLVHSGLLTSGCGAIEVIVGNVLPSMAAHLPREASGSCDSSPIGLRLLVSCPPCGLVHCMLPFQNAQRGTSWLSLLCWACPGRLQLQT